MPEAPKLLNWDACCFTSYIDEDADRPPVLTAILDEAAHSKGKHIFVTSIISRVEVAFSAEERHGKALSDEQEAAIDALWADDDVVRVVEVHPLVVDTARALLRSGVPKGWTGLRANDAIHLATAKVQKVAEVHTYEKKGIWERHEPEIGCKVVAPQTDKPYLPGLLAD